MILDTEMYSNTGGQVSKSSNMASILKFSQDGKKDMKKDFGRLAMQYQKVYVASISLGANYNQSMQAIREAESYKGPSVIIAYAPCIDWGIGMKDGLEWQKLAVEAGMRKLCRFDPHLVERGMPPRQLTRRD